VCGMVGSGLIFIGSLLFAASSSDFDAFALAFALLGFGGSGAAPLTRPVALPRI